MILAYCHRGYAAAHDHGHRTIVLLAVGAYPALRGQGRVGRLVNLETVGLILMIAGAIAFVVGAI